MPSKTLDNLKRQCHALLQSKIKEKREKELSTLLPYKTD